ncbi:MAG: hypothetical protein AAGD07_10445 [Planctomycetota bacterium]
MTDIKKPLDTLRLPGGMKATTWENTSEKGHTFTTTTITRTYKAGDEFKDSTSFSHDELLKVSKIAEQAYLRIAEIKNGKKND